MKVSMTVCLFIVLCVSVTVFAEDDSGQSNRPVRPVLLVIDVQNEYLPMMDQTEIDPATRMINGAIWLFRQHELPVIRVYHTDPTWGPEPGSEGFEFPESVNVTAEDPQVIKNFPSAFTETELDEILEAQDANTLFLCGLSATGCALATYFGAQDRHYDVFMIEGGMMSASAEHTGQIVDILNSVGWASMNAIVTAATAR